MTAQLDSQVAIVTGGSRGIGLETAAELLRSGVRGVTITGRKPDTIEAAAGELAAAGFQSERILAVAARAESEEDAARAVARTVERFGSVDILVNNAGTNPSPGSLMDVDMGAVDKTWAVNQRGPLLWTRAVWAGWMSGHGGCVVNVASVGGLRPAPVLGAYNISKAALVFMTHQLAFELAPTVRVNAVAPAIVRTKLSEMLWKSDEAATAATHPLNRLGEVSDVAEAIVFLCRSDWLTGVVLPVDGGVIGASASLG